MLQCGQGVNFSCMLAAPQHHKQSSEPSEPASSRSTENLFFQYSDLSHWDRFSLPMKEIPLLCTSHSAQTATVEDWGSCPPSHYLLLVSAPSLPLHRTFLKLYRWLSRTCCRKVPQTLALVLQSLLRKIVLFIKIDSKCLRKTSAFLRVKDITRVKKK